MPTKISPTQNEPTNAKPGISWMLWVLLAVSLALSVFFAFHVPFGANPDETAHRDYIRLILQNHGFVRFVSTPFDKQFAPFEPTPWETHQPPLYYLLCVPVQMLCGETHAFRSMILLRLVGALLQLATIALAYRATSDLIPERTEIAIGAAAFVAFLPSQAQLAASINNDCLTTLICVVILWKLARIAVKGQKRGGVILLGALLGAGILTKLSVLQLLPSFTVAYFLAVRAGKLTTRRAFLLGSLTIGLGLLIASPWLIRNTLLYGDPLALSVYKLTGPNFTPQDVMGGLFGQSYSWGGYANLVGQRSFATFWYLLPPNVLRSPAPQLRVVTLLAVVGLIGMGIYFGKRQGTPEERRALIVALFAPLLLLPFFVKFVLTVFQAQGRYFLPVLLPVALLTVVGWASLSERRSSLAVGAVVFILFALTLAQIRTF